MHQELIHISHLLFILSCLEIQPRHDLSNITYCVRKHTTGYQHREERIEPLIRGVWVNITVAHRCHRSEGPIERCQVFLWLSLVLDASVQDPTFASRGPLLVSDVPEEACDPMGNENDNEHQLQEFHEGVHAIRNDVVFDFHEEFPQF